MISWGRHSERAIAAATAVLLQAAVYLALSQRYAAVPHAESAPTIIAMLLAVARPKREPPPARQLPARPELRLLTMPPVTQPIIPTRPQAQPSRSAFDWRGAIQGEVGKELARAAAPPKRQFGFPKMPAEQAPPRQWDGWDETRLNRIQRLAHGVIDLGHGCFILLFPPIPQCHSDAPEGDLFDHMHDRQDEVPGALP
ncbi:MAG: hypothetical protein ACREVO_16585 [Steroidobacteraceae bacterium]